MGDLLRPADGLFGPVAHQTANIRWLHALLSRVLGAVSSSPLAIVCDGSSFDFAAAWDVIGLEPSPENWASLYEGSPENEVAVALLSASIKADLVVAFEPSPVLEQAVERAGARLISVSIHPYRFAHDLFLGFRTRDPALHRALSRSAARGDSLEIDAAVVQARCLRNPGTGEHGRSLALLLQEPFDATMIDRGAFRTQDDLFGLAARVVCDFDDVLVRPRPNNPTVPVHILGRLADALGRNVRVTTAHAYRLIADPGVGAFAAVSSGALDEAAFFGRPIFRIFEQRYKLAPWREPASSDPGSVLMMDSHVLQPEFWRSVLTPAKRSRPNALPPPLATRAVLRESLGEDWGFSALSADPPSAVVWHRPEREIELGPGDKLHFGDGSPALRWLRGAWHDPQSDHIWSIARAVSLVVPIAGSSVSGRSIIVTVTGRVLDASKAAKITLTIDGRSVTTNWSDELGSFRVTALLPSSMEPRRMTCAIEARRTARPEWLGLGDDRRRLGVALYGIESEFEGASSVITQGVQAVAARSRGLGDGALGLVSSDGA